MVTYVENGDLVDSFALRIRLRGQVLVNVLEVRYGHILLELLIENDIVVNQLNAALEVSQGADPARLLMICRGRA